MALCAVCGGKVGLLGGLIMGDGNYLCNQCAKKITKEHKKAAESFWSAEDYVIYQEFKKDSDQKKEIFSPNFQYGNLLIDSMQGLFCVLDHPKEDYHKANIDVYSFKDLRYIDFPTVLVDYKVQLLSVKNYTMDLNVYITFATKDRCIAVSKPIGGITASVEHKKLQVESGVEKLQEFRKMTQMFMKMIELSQAGMERAWIDEKSKINARSVGMVLGAFVQDYYSFFSQKNLEYSMSLYQIENLDIGCLFELKKKEEKLLEVFCDGKDTEEAKYMKTKIKVARELLVYKILCTL